MESTQQITLIDTEPKTSVMNIDEILLVGETSLFLPPTSEFEIVEDFEFYLGHS